MEWKARSAPLFAFFIYSAGDGGDTLLKKELIWLPFWHVRRLRKMFMTTSCILKVKRARRRR
jgi:hypothetical protein